MREPSLSDPLYNLLGYFANGEIVFSDQYPSHLPNWELFPVLLSRDLVEKVPINPNELIYHIDKPLRTFYYAISASGKELYFLEKEIRNERDKHDPKDRPQRLNTNENQKKQFRHDYFVAAFSELIAAGLPHLLPKLIDFVRTFFKSRVGH